MGKYFLDTSAIVKCYFPESGQPWVLNLCNPEQGHDLYISQAALVEVVAAICRKARDQNMLASDRDKLISLFRKDCKNIYSIKRVTAATYTFVGNLCRLHRLRAYDAVQLACALTLRNAALVNQTSVPVFILQTTIL
jgi:uncharacterized protein